MAPVGTIGDFTTQASCQKYCKVPVQVQSTGWYSSPYYYRHPALRSSYYNYPYGYYGGIGLGGIGNRYRRAARREARRARGLRIEGKHRA